MDLGPFILIPGLAQHVGPKPQHGPAGRDILKFWKYHRTHFLRPLLCDPPGRSAPPPTRSYSHDSDGNGSVGWAPLSGDEGELHDELHDEYQDFCSEYGAGDEIRNVGSFNSEDGAESSFGDGGRDRNVHITHRSVNFMDLATNFIRILEIAEFTTWAVSQFQSFPIPIRAGGI